MARRISPARSCVVAASKKSSSRGSRRQASRSVLVRAMPWARADQDRVGHHPVAIGEADAAIGADGGDGADQMLVGAHAAGHAVHDDADAAFRHCLASPG
jgi:hypothetical protein